MSNNAAAEFTSLVLAVVRRFFIQNAQTPPSPVELEALAARLWTLIEERGLPQPLAAGDRRRPGELPEAVTANLTGRVAGSDAVPLLAEAARQLVKTCFYPEFRNCRDTFRAVSPDGVCRRQQLSRVRGRISGSHCVDCPHWLRLPPAQHAAFLALEWRGDRAELEAHRGIFLPEDFRALRRWLRARAARPAG